MKKEYSFKVSDDPSMVNELKFPYSTHSHQVHFDVTIEDESLIVSVQKALQMIKGVTSVKLASISDGDSGSDPFAELDTKWGGDRDANDIADEAQKAIDALWDNGSINEETIETWGKEHMRTPYKR